MPPVEDHPVHESTRQRADARYLCHNKPRPWPEEAGGGYMAPNGYSEIMDDAGGFQDARVKLDFVPFRMSVECRHDKSLSDQKCAGCQWAGSGEEYFASVTINVSRKT